MTIIIAWDRVTARVTAKGMLSSPRMRYVTESLKERGFDGFQDQLVPSDEALSQQYLEFAAESFLHGKEPATVIKEALEMSSYGWLRPSILVQAAPGRQFERLEDFAANQEQLAAKRLRAMQSVVGLEDDLW